MKRLDFPTKGFSLIETMIVLFLMAAMLFCVAKLTGETLSTLKFLQEKSASTESATLACQRLAAELREAISVPNLSSGVSFRKVRPSALPLVGNDPVSDSSSWTLEYPNNQTSTIRYFQTGDKVLREVSGASIDSALGPIEVATKVNAFDVTQVTPGRHGAYRVVLTILESRRAVTFETVVVCPGVPR